MISALSKLLEISSPALGPNVETLRFNTLRELENIFPEILPVVKLKNGFCAFESALQLRPISSNKELYGLLDWNADGLWKKEYGNFSANVLCFASDIFGNQFSVHEKDIYVFDVETGKISWLASSFEEWAENILWDYDNLIGWSFASTWQKTHGVLQNSERLYPITPFVLGGKYEIANFRSLDAAQIMRNAGNIAHQIRGIPDGADVRLTPRSA